MKSLITILGVLLLGATAVNAADLAVPPPSAPVAEVAAAYDWSGPYVGGHLGWGAVDESWTIPDPTRNAGPGYNIGDGSASGFTGGVQAGYNWQMGNVLLGVETSASLGGASPHISTPGNPYDNRCTGGGQATADCYSTTNWSGDLVARVGFTAGPALFYLRGGVAVIGDTFNIDNGYWNFTQGHNVFAYNSVDQTRFGGTVGIGVAGAVSDNLSVFAEANYSDFGTQNVSFTSKFDNIGFLAQPFTASISQVVKDVRVGINYKF